MRVLGLIVFTAVAVTFLVLAIVSLIEAIDAISVGIRSSSVVDFKVYCLLSLFASIIAAIAWHGWPV